MKYDFSKHIFLFINFIVNLLYLLTCDTNLGIITFVARYMIQCDLSSALIFVSVHPLESIMSSGRPIQVIPFHIPFGFR